MDKNQQKNSFILSFAKVKGLQKKKTKKTIAKVYRKK